jgi:hypothetical protein
MISLVTKAVESDLQGGMLPQEMVIVGYSCSCGSDWDYVVSRAEGPVVCPRCHAVESDPRCGHRHIGGGDGPIMVSRHVAFSD